MRMANLVRSSKPVLCVGCLSQHWRIAVDFLDSHVVGSELYVITIERPEAADRQENPPDYDHYIDRQIRPVAEPLLGILKRDFDEIRRNHRQLELSRAKP